MALTGSGEAFTYNGSSWSAPTKLGSDLTLVSCVSESFCVAVGGDGVGSLYDGSTWSVPSAIGLSEPSSISCASESFCMAVGSVNGGPGFAVAYDGSSWSSPTEIASGDDDPGPRSVSCGSPTFCVAVGGNPGDEETYRDGSWLAPTAIGYRESVSCHGESFCVALARGGEASVYRSGTWSSTSEVSEDASAAVSCPSESFCMATGDYAASYSASSWGEAVPLGGGGLASVSCTSPSLCTAVDYHGRVLTYDGSGWSAPKPIAAELAALSCPAAGFCAAVGGYHHGYALTYDGAGWAPPTEVDGEGTMHSVSCVSAHFCVALSQHGREKTATSYALVYDGTGWSAPREIDSHSVLSSVSCVSEAFCLAVGEHEVAIYNGSSWSAPTVVDTEGNLHAVSCASSSFCEAVVEDYNSPGWHLSQGIIFDGSSWSTLNEIPRAPERTPFDPGSISCSSSSFCMAGALFEGAAAIYEAGAWAPWAELGEEGNDGVASVSCPSASFCAIVDNAGQAFTYVSSTPHFPLAVFITGEGEVTSTPAGIMCSTAECTYEPEGEVTLTPAKIGAGYEFAGWIGCTRVAGTDCMVNGASKVTALFLKAIKEGAAGTEGRAGKEGEVGAAGPAGEKGNTGARGETGPPGAQGPAGKIELVTCDTVKGKQHCTTKLVSGTVKFTTSGSSTQATLSRHGVVYATGAARIARGRMSLRLVPLRGLRPGKYTLTLISGTGRHKRISRESFILN
ncbi:MAG: collagen-like protein [Solirubrobacteraceae bacterium]